MSEKINPTQDPSLTAGSTIHFREIDLHNPDVIELLREHGELFQRKIEPVKGVRDPEAPEQVDTVVNGIVESSQIAEPGKHKIITGSRGEEFVFTQEKFDNLYTHDDDGSITPRERRVLAMQNPFAVPIETQAPWSTPEDPQIIHGTEEAILVFSLDDAGELTDDRYLIGDREMLLHNYDPVVS